MNYTNVCVGTWAKRSGEKCKFRKQLQLDEIRNVSAVDFYGGRRIVGLE